MITVKDLVEQFIDNTRREIDSPNIDCSELADWLSKELQEQGVKNKLVKILALKNNKENYFFVEEFDRKEKVMYHYVVKIGNVYIDVRNSKIAIYVNEYLDKLRKMNPELKIITENE